jgi:hypothetical protein
VRIVGRATSVVVACGLVAALAGCGGGEHHAATRFCAAIERGHPAFDSIDASKSSTALTEFDRVSESAPAALAPDLAIVSSVLRALYRDPASVANDPARFKSYIAATRRVDRYLHETCGVRIPPAGKFF